MKIGIITDSHDHEANTKQAVDHITDKGCEALLFCGDFCCPGPAKIMARFDGEKHFIFGNNDGDHYSCYTQGHAIDPNIHWHRESQGEFEIDGVKIFITHYPKYAEHAVESERYDLVSFGHSHVSSITKTGKTLSVNAGGLNPDSRSIKEPSFAVYDTETKSATIYDLDGNVLEQSE